MKAVKEVLCLLLVWSVGAAKVQKARKAIQMTTEMPAVRVVQYTEGCDSPGCTTDQARVPVDNQLENVEYYPEVYVDDEWHPICMHYFDDNSNYGSKLICQALGFSDGTRGIRTYYQWSENSVPVGNCLESDTDITNCYFNGAGFQGYRFYEYDAATDCNAGRSAGVTINCTGLVLVDECATGTHNCDTNALCTDTANSFGCQCNSGYTGDGITCSATSGASGDPHFRGFDGSQYDFQGSPGVVFNLITDEAFQLNARFVESPTDRKTYMGAVGLTVGSNNILVTPEVVVVNDASIAEGNHVYLDNEEGSNHLGLIISDHGRVRVKTEPFHLDIRIVEQEGFIYLDIDAVASSNHLVHPHGILGQSAQYMVDGSEPHPVHLSHQNIDAHGFLAGIPADYIVADGLFGTTFPFNRFGKGASPTKTQIVRRFGFGRALGQERL